MNTRDSRLKKGRTGNPFSAIRLLSPADTRGAVLVSGMPSLHFFKWTKSLDREGKNAEQMLHWIVNSTGSGSDLTGVLSSSNLSNDSSVSFDKKIVTNHGEFSQIKAN